MITWLGLCLSVPSLCSLNPRCGHLMGPFCNLCMMWHGHLCPTFPDSTHLILQSACPLESRYWCVLMESNYLQSFQSSLSFQILSWHHAGSSLAPALHFLGWQPFSRTGLHLRCATHTYGIFTPIRIPYSGSPPSLVHMCFISDGVWQSNCSLKEVSTGHGYVTERQFLIQRSTFTSFFKQDWWWTLQEWPQPEEKEQRQWE